MAVPFSDIKAELMKRPEFRAAYDALAPEYERVAAELAAHPTNANAPAVQAEALTSTPTTEGESQA